jgi:hypothetical protein
MDNLHYPRISPFSSDESTLAVSPTRAMTDLRGGKVFPSWRFDDIVGEGWCLRASLKSGLDFSGPL